MIAKHLGADLVAAGLTAAACVELLRVAFYNLKYLSACISDIRVGALRRRIHMAMLAMLLVPAASAALFDNIDRLRDCTPARKLTAAEFAKVLEADQIYVIRRASIPDDHDTGWGWLRGRGLDGFLQAFPEYGQQNTLESDAQLLVTGTVFKRNPSRLKQFFGVHFRFGLFEIVAGEDRFVIDATNFPGEEWPLCEAASDVERGGRNWAKHPPSPPGAPPR